MNHRLTSTYLFSRLQPLAKVAYLSLGCLAFVLTLQVHAYTYTTANLTTSADSPSQIERIPLQVTATQVSPASITITTYAPGTFTISRKDPSANTWTQLTSGQILSAGGTWTDSSVTVGQMYEYQFVNTASTPLEITPPYNIFASGYILAGIQVDQTQPKGMIAVVTANDLPVNLPTEYAQYKADLVNDGWQVREIQVPRCPDNYSGLGNGAISTFTVTNGGTTSLGSGSIVYIKNSSGKVAEGTVTVSSGAIKSISPGVSIGGVGVWGNIGSGFAVGDQVTLSGGAVTTGTVANLYGVVSNPTQSTLSYAYPNTGGSDYAQGDSVTLVGQASGATATGTISYVNNGSIEEITVNQSGQTGTFQSGELLTMTDTSNTAGSGVGPITAYISNTQLVTGDVTIASGGSGYTNGQSISLTGQTSKSVAYGTLVVTSGQITGFTITYSNSGFIVGEKLTLAGNTGGSGVGILTVNAVSTGQLNDVSIYPPGMGYTQGETAILTGNQSGATAQVTLNVENVSPTLQGVIDYVTIVSSQSGFIPGESLTLSLPIQTPALPGSGAPLFIADIAATGPLSSVTVSSGGTLYTNGAAVQINGGSTPAFGTLVVTTGGVITGVNVTSGGAGFQDGGYLTLSASTTGTNITVATVNNTNRGSPVAISAGGSGYSDNDTVTIKGNVSGATAIGSLIAPSGSITGISVVLSNTGGTGSFTTGETLTITPTQGGSGVGATVGAPLDNHLLIRSAIQAIYKTFYNNTTQQSQLKNVVMVGKVPVCRSGVNDGAGIDGHGNECPYGTDAFYAEMLGTIGVDWTDTQDNTSDVSLTDYNLPGDSQFDQQHIYEVTGGTGTGQVQLGYGRIDLANGIYTEIEAERNYFNKLHRYKIADPSFLPGRNVCDRLGQFLDIRESDIGAMPGIVGINNINFITTSNLPSVVTGQDSDQLYSNLTGPYLFYFKGSGGPSGGVNGKAVFWTGFQSHWGYWYQASLLSSGSNTMQLRLAENSFTLSFNWDGWGMGYIYHRMGMGMDAGDMMKQSINNQAFTTGPYTYKYNNEANYLGEFQGVLFMDEMGDPAMRLFMFAPPTALSIGKSSGNPVLSWVASTEPTVTGYYVYRAPYANGTYTRLTSTPVTGTTYTDTSVTTGSYVYMVRAARLESTGGGSFYNVSLGTTQSINLTAAATPVTITTTSLPAVAWNTATSLTLAAQGGYPQYSWAITNGSLPTGLGLSTLGVISGTTQLTGTFNFTVQATDQTGQQSPVQALTLTVNQNSLSGAIYPIQTTYTNSAATTTSYGTSEVDYIVGGSGGATPDETFQKYNLSSVNPNNGIAKATVYLYVTSATTATYAPVQANLIADSADGWFSNGASVPFTGYANNGSGKVRIICPNHGLTTGTQVSIAGLTGTGAPTTGPYAITVVDANDFDLSTVTYVAGWAYDPDLAFVNAANAVTYSTRPTTYDPNVSTITGTGTLTAGSVLQFDVTSFVKEALSFPDKQMGIRFFTGTAQTIGVGSLNSFGNSIPYLVIQTTNAPKIVINSPTTSPAYIYTGSSIVLNTTVTPIASRAAALTVQWSQVSGPGTTTFTAPTAAVTGASFSTPGVYVLQIAANDGVETSSQTVTVIVQALPVSGPNDSMVLRFPFDEAAGSTTAQDYSGVTPPNNGTLTTNPTGNPLATFVPAGGKIAGALSFTGTAQRVEVPDSTTNLLDGQKQMAISCWLNSNAFQPTGSTYSALLCKRFAAFSHESYTLAFRGGNVNQANLTWDFNGVGGTSSTVFAVGKWYHVVMQFDGTTTTNNVQLYVNGFPDKFASSTLTAVNRNPTANLRIGAYDSSDTIGWNGLIDEVRIYNRILTLPEIQALYQAVPSDLGPVITTNPSLTGAVGNPLALSASVSESGSGSLSYNWSEINGPSTLTIASPTSISTSTTPNVPGAYNLQFSASDGIITTFAGVAATITGQTYASWASQNGLSGAGAAQTAVTAHDGLTNLFKYALGLIPTTNYNPGATGMPFVAVQNILGTNYLTMTFTGVATDVTYQVQATSNVAAGWTTIQTYPSGNPAPGTVTVQDTQPVSASSKRFMRLLMTIP